MTDYALSGPARAVISANSAHASTSRTNAVSIYTVFVLHPPLVIQSLPMSLYLPSYPYFGCHPQVTKPPFLRGHNKQTKRSISKHRQGHMREVKCIFTHWMEDVSMFF